MIKKVIRKDLPETNSSSSHSVVISLDPSGIIGETEWDLIIDENRNLHIPEFFSFGREFFLTNSALNKLQYLSCYYICGPYINRGVISKQVNKLRTVLKDILGINNIIIDEYVEFCERVKKGEIDSSDLPFFNYPEVDHESFDIFNEILESEETIKNFILNKNTWLYGGSDGSRKAPIVYANTETIPKMIGCISVNFGGEIGRVDVEVSEDLSEDTFQEQLSFLDNFSYNADTGSWYIKSDIYHVYFFNKPYKIIFEFNTIRFNCSSGQVDAKFELYDYGMFSI